MSRVKLLRAELVVLDGNIANVRATIDRLQALGAKPRADGTHVDEAVLPVVLMAHRGHLSRLEAQRGRVAGILNELKAAR